MPAICHLRTRGAISHSSWHAKEGFENTGGAETRPAEVRSSLCGGIQEGDGAAGRATGEPAAGSKGCTDVQNEIASGHQNEDRVMKPFGSRRLAMNRGLNPWRRPSRLCSLISVNTLEALEL